MTSNGTPMVLAVPQYFWYSSMRSRLVARRRLPVTWKLTSCPVSLRQALVEVDRVLVQLADGVAHVEQRQQSRGMPGGAGGELGALDQRDVRPALLRQVIERAHADHAAADDQRPEHASSRVFSAGEGSARRRRSQCSGQALRSGLQLRQCLALIDAARGLGQVLRHVGGERAPHLEAELARAVRHSTTSALASIVRVHMPTGNAAASQIQRAAAASSVARRAPLHLERHLAVAHVHERVRPGSRARARGRRRGRDCRQRREQQPLIRPQPQGGALPRNRCAAGLRRDVNAEGRLAAARTSSPPRSTKRQAAAAGCAATAIR